MSKMTTEQEEAEAAKAAESDSAAMEKLLNEMADEAQPPPTDEPATPPPEPTPTPDPPKGEEPPAAAPPAAPEPAGELKPKDTPTDQDEFEKELNSDKYELPAGSTRSAKEINKAIKTHASNEHKARVEIEGKLAAAEAERAELQTKLAAASKDTEELGRYKPIVERLAIERDPRFSVNYDQRIGKIEGTIISNLRAAGLSEQTAKYIMAHGGPAHFSKDSASTVEAEPDSEGGDPVRMSHRQFWEKRVLPALTDDHRDSIRLAFDDVLRVRQAKDAAIRSALSDREKYFKDLAEQETKNRETFKAECKKEMEATEKEMGDLIKPREIPKNATPEEKAFIETHNAAIKAASERFDEFFMDRSPKALVRKNFGGLILEHLPALLKAEQAKTAAVQAKLDALQKKWDASVKSANTSHRQSVQQTSKPDRGIEAEPNDGLRMEKMLEQLPA